LTFLVDCWHDGAVLEDEAQRRLDDTGHVEVLANGSVLNRQIDVELVEPVIAKSEDQEDVDRVVVRLFIDVDVDL